MNGRGEGQRGLTARFDEGPLCRQATARFGDPNDAAEAVENGSRERPEGE